MGRQINYYIEYESFLEIAQAALECGCIIIKQDLKSRPSKVFQSRDISIVTKDCWHYYFYLPEAGSVRTKTYDYGERIDYGYNECGNAMIEAGFSIVREEKKEIRGERLFVMTGYYDDSGSWIPRPNCLNKVYNKLVRLVKKLAPNKDKEYVSDYCLKLHKEQGYKYM